MLQLSVRGRSKTPSRKLSGLQTREKVEAEEEVTEDTEDYTGKVFSFNLMTPGMSFAATLRSSTGE
jgi:hypothetical protein